MEKIILGLDVSSSTIGWGAVKVDFTSRSIKLIDCGYIKPEKKGSLVKRIASTREQVISIFEMIKPDYIGIEDIIQFIKGRSSANTVIMLATFNRMICLLSYDWLRIEPELFSVLSIRHGLKLSAILPKKEDMPNIISKHLSIPFPFIKNKRGKITVESYDVADGIAVALYYANYLINKM